MENNEKQFASKVNKIVFTGDVHGKIDNQDGNLYFINGNNAIEVTVQVKEGFTSGEVLETLKEIFQKTTKCFEQFL